MTANQAEARFALARDLKRSYTNDWGGSDHTSEIAAARFAVVLEREDDAWVLAANDLDRIADIALATYTGTDGYDEWISEIWDMEKGDRVEWSYRVAVTLQIGDDCATAS